MIESQAERVFIRSKYDKSYKYLNQEGMDGVIDQFGLILKDPVYKKKLPTNY